jgi:nucleoside-diphosphate-sugar epimerase
MHVMVIGAAGMVGRKLVEKFAADEGALGYDISKLTLVDVIEPPVPQALSAVATTLALDLSRDGAAEKLVASRPGVIFHLAAIVSGEAEADFDKGYQVNLDGTRALFEAIRQEGLREPYVPRVIFAS